MVARACAQLCIFNDKRIESTVYSLLGPILTGGLTGSLTLRASRWWLSSVRSIRSTP